MGILFLASYLGSKNTIFLNRMVIVDYISRIFIKIGKFFKEKHKKAWRGVSILVLKEDSATMPQGHRINFYVLIFFVLLVTCIPLLALGLNLERRFKKGENPVEVMENRQILLNTFKLVKEHRKTLIKEVEGQLKSFQKLTGNGEPELLERYISEQSLSVEKGVGMAGDQMYQELNELRHIRRYSVILNDSAYYTLNTLWNRIYLHHILPRNRPLPPGEGRISSLYGNRVDPFASLRGVAGPGEFHFGLDFAAIEGEPIMATAPGIVIKTSAENVKEGYGNNVRVHHGMGYITIYAHCSRILVKPGDMVNRGQILGLVGQSGRATGSHLHYEVRLGEHVTLDPLPFVRLK